MVRHHDAQLARARLAQALRHAGDLRIGYFAVLAAARPRGVHADGEQARIFEHWLQHRAQRALVVAVRIERAREQVEKRDVVVARHGQHRQRQAFDEFAGGGELPAPRALRDVAAEHDQIRVQRTGQVQRGLDHGFALGAEVRVG
ncbi:hypothetical protein D3C78_1454220 [compost metagenome]